jgi:hypothetical protein
MENELKKKRVVKTFFVAFVVFYQSVYIRGDLIYLPSGVFAQHVVFLTKFRFKFRTSATRFFSSIFQAKMSKNLELNSYSYMYDAMA